MVTLYLWYWHNNIASGYYLLIDKSLRDNNHDLVTYNSSNIGIRNTLSDNYTRLSRYYSCNHNFFHISVFIYSNLYKGTIITLILDVLSLQNRYTAIDLSPLHGYNMDESCDKLLDHYPIRDVGYVVLIWKERQIAVIKGEWKTHTHTH
jgi:hypothetical protein